ncbi:MAG TPA: 30S ribosomal protein S4 [Candidatus Nanoarchaeia archaeon]|nr:30S ribosomal protein S4 [Candidatus Nanoarchaeia archaeon]
MGDPKKIKKKYATPLHPWVRSRIEDDKKLRKEFGFKTKRELWKMDSLLRNFKHQAKQLIAREDPQSAVEEKLLQERLFSLGLVPKDAKLVDVLSLAVRDVLARRLQTMVVKRGLARSVKQARQFIAHRHVMVNGKVIDAPTYLVGRDEELAIAFVPASSLNSADHPERALATVKVGASGSLSMADESPEEKQVLADKGKRIVVKRKAA